MPELPEVETVCRGLAALVGARLVSARAFRADLRDPIPQDLSARLKGKKITAIDRRAKYILIHVEGGLTIILHLGMSGRITLSFAPQPRGKHDHIEWRTDNGATVRFRDPRRFGFCDLCATDALEKHKSLRTLGIEPLSASFTPQRLAALMANAKTPFKTALLDQTRIAGLGNIYVCEALFSAGINPRRMACSCTPDEARLLTAAIKKVLKAAIKAGGSTLRDYAHTDGTAGYFQHHFSVYGHEGEACPRCDAPIRRIVQSARSTFFCASCQK